ncbi:MAG: Tm-1-like ATP-binding domain-containing protein, partial [Deltaproteobacteria bacterium]|nr:Tm-1-like ATP-binding domain-containing protein [Deltaproteobacteria bacterium]
PKGGLSTLDCPQKPYWNPEADKALLNTLRQNLDDSIPLIELDSYINDDQFAKTIANEFIKLLILE